MIVILIIDDRPLPPMMPTISEINAALEENDRPVWPVVFEQEPIAIQHAKPVRPKSHLMKTPPRRAWRKQTR